MKQYKMLQLAMLGLLLALLSLNPFSLSFAKTKLPINSEPVHVIGRMSVTLSQAERVEFNRLTNILFEKTTQLDLPALYTCNEDVISPGTYVWDEVWSSKEALNKHLDSKHFKAWWSWVEPRLSGPLKVKYVDEAAMKKA
jgi:quinol monooxygenase YgiN